jgi:hypothetical protein
LVAGSARVVEHIKGIPTWGDKHVLVQPKIDGGKAEVVVYAIRPHSKGKDVLDKISFWLQQQGLDKFVEVFLNEKKFNYICTIMSYQTVQIGRDVTMARLIDSQIPA